MNSSDSKTKSPKISLLALKDFIYTNQEIPFPSNKEQKVKVKPTKLTWKEASEKVKEEFEAIEKIDKRFLLLLLMVTVSLIWFDVIYDTLTVDTTTQLSEVTIFLNFIIILFFSVESYLFLKFLRCLQYLYNRFLVLLLSLIIVQGTKLTFIFIEKMIGEKYPSIAEQNFVYILRELWGSAPISALGILIFLVLYNKRNFTVNIVTVYFLLLINYSCIDVFYSFLFEKVIGWGIFSTPSFVWFLIYYAIFSIVCFVFINKRIIVFFVLSMLFNRLASILFYPVAFDFNSSLLFVASIIFAFLIVSFSYKRLIRIIASQQRSDINKNHDSIQILPQGMDEQGNRLRLVQDIKSMVFDSEQKHSTLGFAGRRGLGKTNLLYLILNSSNISSDTQEISLEEDDLRISEKIKKKRIQTVHLFVRSPSDFEEMSFLTALLEQLSLSVSRKLSRILPAVESYAVEIELKEKQRLSRILHLSLYFLLICLLSVATFMYINKGTAPYYKSSLSLTESGLSVNTLEPHSDLYYTLSKTLVDKIINYVGTNIDSLDELASLLQQRTHIAGASNQRLPPTFYDETFWAKANIDSLKQKIKWKKNLTPLEMLINDGLRQLDSVTILEQTYSSVFSPLNNKNILPLFDARINYQLILPRNHLSITSIDYAVFKETKIFLDSLGLTHNAPYFSLMKNLDSILVLEKKPEIEFKVECNLIRTIGNQLWAIIRNSPSNNFSNIVEDRGRALDRNIYDEAEKLNQLQESMVSTSKQWLKNRIVTENVNIEKTSSFSSLSVIFYLGVVTIPMMIFGIYYSTRRGVRKFRSKIYDPLRNEIALYNHTEELLDRLRYHLSVTEGKEFSASAAPAGLSKIFSALNFSTNYSSQTSRESRPFTILSLTEEYRKYVKDVVFYLQNAQNVDEHNASDLKPEIQIVIAIDELDKILNIDRLHEMLKSLKAIFEIEHVYYLLSISEDALGTYRLRHVETKNEIDSSFTHIFSVPPMDSNASADFFKEKVPDEIIIPAIVLGGGVPRDMHRLAQVISLRKWKSGIDCLNELFQEDVQAVIDLIQQNVNVSDIQKNDWISDIRKFQDINKTDVQNCLIKLSQSSYEEFEKKNPCTGEQAKKTYYHMTSLLRAMYIKGYIYWLTKNIVQTQPTLNEELYLKLEPLRDAIFNLSTNPLGVWDDLQKLE